MFLRGQMAAAQADWPKVREAFEALVKEFPDSQRRLAAEFWIAEAYYRQADYAAAGPRFERLAQQIKGKREPWMAMIPLRRAQVLAQQNQWTDAYAIAAKIAADFPNFEQQYEVDYLLGRCLANQADFDGARQALQPGDPLARRRENRDRGHGPVDDRRNVLPPEKLRDRAAGVLAAGNPLCLSDLAGGGPAAGRQVPRTAGRRQGGGRTLPTHSENLSQHDFCRRGRPAAKNARKSYLERDSQQEGSPHISCLVATHIFLTGSWLSWPVWAPCWATGHSDGQQDGLQGLGFSVAPNQGGKARTSLFGIVGEGYKFVYVFDRSGSMGGIGANVAAGRQSGTAPEPQGLGHRPPVPDHFL